MTVVSLGLSRVHPTFDSLARRLRGDFERLGVLRIVFSGNFVSPATASSTPAAGAYVEPAPDAAAFRYDVGGLVRLDSDAELPELACFATAATTPPDIRIRIGDRRALPARLRLERIGERITYHEHLGVLDADFTVRLGRPIEVEVEKLLAFSRHALYANVVEQLLRFVLVSTGHVLVASTVIDADGGAALLSAGAVGERGTPVARPGSDSLSCPMAIVDRAGYVRPFRRTVAPGYRPTARTGDESGASGRRVRLRVQTRVRSKSGRSQGQGVRTLNVPMMSIDSVVRLVVPPPAFAAPSAVGVTPPARITQVYLAEREHAEAAPGATAEAAVDRLLEPAAEAGPFGPFGAPVPELEIAGLGSVALRAREREILSEALRGVPVTRLGVRGPELG